MIYEKDVLGRIVDHLSLVRYYTELFLIPFRIPLNFAVQIMYLLVNFWAYYHYEV